MRTRHHFHQSDVLTAADLTRCLTGETPVLIDCYRVERIETAALDVLAGHEGTCVLRFGCPAGALRALALGLPSCCTCLLHRHSALVA